MLKKLINKLFPFKELKLCNEPKQLVTQHLLKINTEEILLKIEASKDISYIPTAFCFLLSENVDLKEKTAKVLNKIVSSIPISQFNKLDSMFRERTSLEWSYDWRDEDPNNLIEPSFSDAEKIVVFGLASFHPNGYFREKAIKALAYMTTGNEMPYLVIRLNDWVEIVRRTAKNIFTGRINPRYLKNIVDNLPLIFRLGNCLRHEHNDIINSVISLLSERDSHSELERGLASKEVKVRSLCYEIILKTKAFSNIRILKHLLKDISPHIRLHVFRQISEKITLEEFDLFKEDLLRDKYAPLRALTLEVFYNFYQSESVLVLEKSIFDEHISVRETARYLLSKINEYDFRMFYQKALEQLEFIIGSISGLGETGKKDDTIYLIPFLDNEKTKIVRTTIKALSKLSFGEFKVTFLSLLTDKRIGVSKEARLVLSKRVDSVYSEIIHTAYIQSKHIHVRKNAAILLCSLNKWDAIVFILEACADKEEPIAFIGRYFLSKWINSFNKSFISPSRRQIEIIEKALEMYYVPDMKKCYELIKFNLESFMH